MAKPDGKDSNPEKDEAMSLDNALLDEFFSIVASVAIRLTKTDVRAKNADTPIEQEVNDQ